MGIVSKGLSQGWVVMLLVGSCCPPNLPNVGFEMASAESTPVMCADPQTREIIRTILSDGLNDALKQHVVKVFGVWMADERGQPERARTGVTNGVAAYLRASKSVATWAPPDCPG